MPLFIQEHTTSRMVVTSEAKKRKVFVQEETEGSFKGILDTLFLKVLDLLFSILFCVDIKYMKIKAEKKIFP